MAKLERFTIEAFGPYRFIGKTVFAPPGSGEIFGGMWGRSAPVFEAIRAMSDYATEEIHDVALMTWDTEKNLLGYTVGRFMKPDAPVPEGLDFVEVDFFHMAKGWVSGEFNDMIADAGKLTEEAVKAQDTYTLAWSERFVGAEVYAKDTVPKDGVHSVLGYYIPTRK